MGARIPDFDPNMSTALDYDFSVDYRTALTEATPKKTTQNNLYFRNPDQLMKLLPKDKKEVLVNKLRDSYSGDNNGKNIKSTFLEVFSDLLFLLEIPFTIDQIKDVVDKLLKFDNDGVIPIEELEGLSDLEGIHLLNETYGPTDAFKDIALQVLGGLIGIVVREKNESNMDYAVENKKKFDKDNCGCKNIKDWYRKKHKRMPKLTFVINQTSTTGDTGPAAGQGVVDERYILNIIGFPANESTEGQIGQMLGLLSIGFWQSFSEIQELMKAGNTKEYNKALVKLIETELADVIEEYGFTINVDAGSFNSINQGRVDVQTIYHTHSHLQAEAKGIIKPGDNLIEVVPSGNGGHVYSTLMSRLISGVGGATVVTCNRNNMFYKIIEEGRFQMPPDSDKAFEDPSVSMIIKFPNNMIRLFSYAFGPERAKEITDLFFREDRPVVELSKEEKNIFKEKLNIHAYRVTPEEELQTIGKTFKETKRLICPHTANALCGLKKFKNQNPNDKTKSQVSETASPWKFLASIAAGLSYEDFSHESDNHNVVQLYNRYKELEKSPEGIRELLDIISEKYSKYGMSFSMNLIPEDLRKIYTDGFERPKVNDAKNFAKLTIEIVKKEVSNLVDPVREYLRQKESNS